MNIPNPDVLADRSTPLARAQARQRRWATSRGLSVDSRGYLEGWEANLLRPLSEAMRTAFNTGSGSELLDRGPSPAKMRALISSSALAVNFFGFWDTAPEHLPALANAMGLPLELRNLHFEDKCPTGLRGTPPNLDVLFCAKEGIVGVESKFTEWMTPKRPNLGEFRKKYLAADRQLWSGAGLPRCQAISELHASGTLGFRHLDVAQLLKHGLGLVRCHGPSARLSYVYWDDRQAGTETHAHEVRRFEDLLDGELGFTAWRYQELVTRLERGAYLALKTHLAAFAARYCA